jgi:hypothetical protein
LADPGALVSWSYLQYRAVALTDTDLDRAGMALPSEPSRSYALLNPPPDLPTLTLSANIPGSTETVALVRVDTDALRRGSDIGDTAVAPTAPAATPPVRFNRALGTVADFASVGDLLAASDPVGYVGGNLYMRLPPTPGQIIGAAVDVTDPLARSTHAVLDAPAELPEPLPVVVLTAKRGGGAIQLQIDTNMPLPVDPERD